MTTTDALECGQDETPRDEELLGPRTKRRRTSKADPVLAEAVDVARAGVLEITGEETLGLVHHVRGEEDRLTTHLFECLLPGYRGWFWYATLSRVPRGKVATVCEVGLLPGDDSLLAPAWVPWAERVRPEEMAEEKARVEEEARQNGEDPAGAGESTATETTRGDQAADEKLAKEQDTEPAVEPAAAETVSSETVEDGKTSDAEASTTAEDTKNPEPKKKRSRGRKKKTTPADEQ